MTYISYQPITAQDKFNSSFVSDLTKGFLLINLYEQVLFHELFQNLI